MRGGCDRVLLNGILYFFEYIFAYDSGDAVLQYHARMVVFLDIHSVRKHIQNDIVGYLFTVGATESFSFR